MVLLPQFLGRIVTNSRLTNTTVTLLQFRCRAVLQYCFCFLFLFDWAPEVPVMSVPVVGFSFKPKGLAFVTPLFHLSGYGEGDL